ncbi:MAG: hypothetical protein U5L10_02155 [Candidatus Moranbacteria bacterium]|nr:hypothetical protein [Candidatus Moranbacteria bacterium]
MVKVIYVDKETKIKILAESYILMRKKKSKNGKTSNWKYEGYFSDVESLSKHYLKKEPYWKIEGKKDVRKLINVVRSAEDNIKKLIIKMNI